MEKHYDYIQNLERGMYFSKRAYSDSMLLCYEKIRGSLPKPEISGRVHWIDCYQFAIKTLFSNQHVPSARSGFVSNFVDAAFNEDIFLWDTAFMTLFCNLLHPYIAGIRSLDNFYAKQFEDGEIPRELVRETGKDFRLWVNGYDSPLYSYFHNHYGHRRLKGQAPIPYEALYKPDMGRVIEKHPYLTLDNLNHPILAFAEWESYCHTHDIGRLQTVLEPLYRYYSAMKYHLRHANGLYVTDWASMDNSPRNGSLGFAVDTSCEMVLFARNLLDIMAVLHKQGVVGEMVARESELSRDILELSDAINKNMWNDADGFYYDLDSEGRHTGIKTVAAFWSLLAQVANQIQINRLVGWLEDSETFNRIHRVPVLAANEPGYDPDGGYWRGSVWAPTNAMVVLGLEKSGEHELAREIALNHLEMVSQVFERTGTLWENYPADAVTSGNADKMDFVGWSGIGPIMFLLQYGIGLGIDRVKDRLVWKLGRDLLEKGPLGCDNYFFFGNKADLRGYLSEGKLRLEIRTKNEFDLDIIFDGQENTVHINGDADIEIGRQNGEL